MHVGELGTDGVHRAATPGRRRPPDSADEAKNDSLDRLLGVSIRAAIVATGYLLRVVGDDRVQPRSGCVPLSRCRDVVNIDKALRT